MEALDGNAIGGDLFEIFGREMTTTNGTCAECRTRAQIAELAVYGSAPGSVVRCRTCASVAFVLVNKGGQTQLHRAGFKLDNHEGS